MNIEIFTLCDAATDNSGKLNILGTFDTMGAPGFPYMHLSCTFVARIRYTRPEKGEHRIRICIVDEDGKDFIPPYESKLIWTIKASQDTAVSHIQLLLQNLVFQEPGNFAINLEIDDKEIGSLPFSVVKAKHQ